MKIAPLELMLFCCCMVLWAYVFGWHTKYSGRPVFTLRFGLRPLAQAVVASVAVATILHFCLDPGLRSRMPADYPDNWRQWAAMTLFGLGFQDLFLLFAPFALFVRLLPKGDWAVHLTVVFGLFMVAAKMQSLWATLPAGTAGMLLAFRVASTLLTIYFYLRGGVILVWIWGFALAARHLLDLR